MRICKDGLLITHSDSMEILPTIYNFFGITKKYTDEAWTPFVVSNDEMIYFCEKEEDWELVKILTDSTENDFYVSSIDILQASKNNEYVEFTSRPTEFTIKDYFDSLV